MKIGIIGIGSITLDFAARAVKANHQVLLCSPRNNLSYREIINILGPNAKLTTIVEAAQTEIIILFLPWEELKNTLKALPNMSGKIILHTNNAIFNPESLRIAEHPKSSKIIAGLLRTADVVKIFNVMIPSGTCYKEGNNIFFSTVNNSTKKSVTAFLETLNFSGIDISTYHKTELLKLNS